MLTSKLESQLTLLNIEETSLTEQLDYLKRKIELAKDASPVRLEEIVHDLHRQVDRARR